MCRNLIKLGKIFLFGFLVLFCVPNGSFSFDLSEEIASKFQTIYNKGFADEYVSNAYSSLFSKDPFGDAMASVDSKSDQLRIAGVQYIQNILALENCSMSNKKIWTILYYFVPEFRSDLARNLKMELGDYNSKKYVLDQDKVIKYCEEYFSCTNMNKKEKIDLSNVSSYDPRNVITNCQEFFQKNYEEGKINEQIMQDIQVSELGADKFWNNSTDDSPYDIMQDFGIFSKLLYEDAQEPITPVFYNVPSFSNSKENLKKDKEKKGEEDSSNSKKNSDNNLDNGNSNTPITRGDMGIQENGGGAVSLGDKNLENEGLQDISGVSPLTSNEATLYDELVDGLDGYGIKYEETSFYNNLCEDDEPEVESENVSQDKNNVPLAADTRTFSDLTETEYQEMVDYMRNAVDEYLDLSEQKKKEVSEKNKNPDNHFYANSSSEVDAVADEIKNCWKSCDGLRIDQKASCMLACACGEIESPIFNPEKTPGLGPIFMIRFCAVPGVNTKFSVGGKRIHAIEEGLREIFGVTDKLSREGRLGKWTQQYEFLDSSTKQMNVFDTFAFSISIEFVDIMEKMGKSSDQYMNKKLKNFNDKAMALYGISNSLDNPVAKNAYVLFGGEGETLEDYSRSLNADTVSDVESELNETMENAFDINADSDAGRYADFGLLVGKWLNQQGALWNQTKNEVTNMGKYAESLYSKKCEK